MVMLDQFFSNQTVSTLCLKKKRNPSRCEFTCILISVCLTASSNSLSWPVPQVGQRAVFWLGENNKKLGEKRSNNQEKGEQKNTCLREIVGFAVVSGSFRTHNSWLTHEWSTRLFLVLGSVWSAHGLWPAAGCTMSIRMGWQRQLFKSSASTHFFSIEIFPPSCWIWYDSPSFLLKLGFRDSVWFD